MVWRKLQVYLTKDDMQLYDDFQRIAQERGVSSSELVKDLMKRFAFENDLPVNRYLKLEIEGKTYQGMMREIQKEIEE